jgi:hypothetical protein
MELREIVPWGRSFDEYRRMFALSEADLAGRTLGCGDGPASFNAEATAMGHSVVSCDPIYRHAADEIRRRVEEGYDRVISQVKRHPDGFVWDVFRDPDDLGRHRLAAMGRFLADFGQGCAEGRYVVASLPRLPFAAGAFRLALVSHLLFLYSGHLDESVHVTSVAELLRVAREVRIFPLVTLERRWSPHVGRVRSASEAAGYVVDIVATDYEFQRAEGRAGRMMMRITCGASTPAGRAHSE